MILELDFSSEIPIYTQIRQEILKAIATGRLKEGEALPSVRQLASEIGINMHTVNKAYTGLKADGFIKVDRRKGAVVEKPGNLITEEYINQLDTDMENVLAEAICRGMTEEKMIEICQKKYRRIKGR